MVSEIIKNKSIILILIVFLIVLIVGLSMYKYLIPTKNETEKLDTYENMMEEMIMPNGIFELKTNYEGDNDLKEFYKSIKRLGEYTIEISSKSDEEIDVEEINNNLKEKYGVINSEDVIKFYRSIKIEDVYNATIDKNTIEKNNKGLKFNMTIEYDDGEEKVLYKVELLNKLYSGNFIKYTYIE